MAYLVILGLINLVYLLKFMKPNTFISKKEYRLWLYIILTTVTESISLFFFTKNNIILFNIYAICFVPVVLYYLMGLLRRNKKSFILMAVFLYSSWALINFLFLQGLHQFNSYSVIIGSVAVTPFLLYYLYQLTQEPVEELQRSSHFYFVIGFLILFIGNFLYFASYNFLHIYYREYLHYSLMIIRINNILSYFLFFIGAIWVKPVPK